MHDRAVGECRYAWKLHGEQKLLMGECTREREGRSGAHSVGWT